jgi:hypothetical protein
MDLQFVESSPGLGLCLRWGWMRVLCLSFEPDFGTTAQFGGIDRGARFFLHGSGSPSRLDDEVLSGHVRAVNGLSSMGSSSEPLQSSWSETITGKPKTYFCLGVTILTGVST